MSSRKDWMHRKLRACSDTPPARLQIRRPRAMRFPEPKPPPRCSRASARPRIRGHSSLSSRKPQAAASPFSVCTVRRRLRAVSASPGDFLQPHRFVVQLLDEFPRALEEQLVEFRHPVLGGHRSHFHLDSLIRRAAVAMHHLKFFGQSQQAFGMADKQVSAGDSSNDKISRPAASVRLRRNTSSRCGRKLCRCAAAGIPSSDCESRSAPVP